jgi:amino acid permease
MADPSNFNRVLRNVLIAVITILICFSCYSYVSFGDRIEDMVTLNLPHDNLTSTVQLIYCIGLLGSYPMQVIPAIDITEKTRWFLESPNPFKKINPYLKNVVSRTAIVLFTGILA